MTRAWRRVAAAVLLIGGVAIGQEILGNLFRIKAPATLPTCAAGIEGAVVRGGGTVDGGFTRNCFCVSDGAATPAYLWCSETFADAGVAAACTGGSTTVCPVAAVAAAASSLLDGGLAYYKMETDSSDSIGSNNGTETGETHVVGKIGSGLNSVASSGRVAFTTMALGTTWSWAAWIFPAAIQQSSWACLFCENGSEGLYFKQSGTTFSYYYSGDHLAATTISVVGWTHVAVVVSAGAVTYYINGTADANTYSSAPSFDPLYIGLHPAGSESYTGLLDEMFVSTRAWTAGEVSTLYNSGAGNQYPF